MNFGPALAMGGSCFRHADGAMRGAGWIHRDGRTEDLLDVVIESAYRPGSIWHTAIRLTGRTASGAPVDVAGRILTICPTKIPMAGGATFVNVAGATSTTYTVATSGSDHGKQYRAQFSNVCGVVASAAAVLTVNALPTCSIAGADAVCASSSANPYSGPAGLTAYRWSVTGSATLSGPTTAQSVGVNAGAAGTFTLTLTLTNASGCSSACARRDTSTRTRPSAAE